MYKSIEISDIIGTLCSEGRAYDAIPMTTIENVFSEVRLKNQFIRIECTVKSLSNIMDLVDSDDILFDGVLRLPQSELIAHRLERKYFQMDYETRMVLTSIVNEKFGK